MYSLSSVQEEIWIDQTLHPGLPLYNIGGYLRIDGPMDPETFNRAIAITIEQHDSLRTILHRYQPAPLQDFPDDPEPDIPFIDLSQSSNPPASAKQWMQSQFVRPFALYGKSLFRFALIRLSRNCHYWFFCFHHLVADGWTVPLVVRTAANAYNSLSDGKKSQPDKNIEKKYSYIDFIREDNRYLKSRRYKEREKYWLSKYSLLPEKLFSYSGSRTPPGNTAQLWLDREFYKRLTLFASRHRASTFQVFLAASYCYFLRTYRAMEPAENLDFVIGLPTLNRGAKAFKNTAGVFTRMLPARFRFGLDLDFSGLLTSIARELRKDYRNQPFPISEINRKSGLHKSGRSRLFDLTLSFEKFDFSARFNGSPIEFVTMSNGCVQEPLAIAVKEYSGRERGDVRLDFVYDTTVFDETQIQLMLKRFRFLLETLLTSASIPLDSLPIVPPEERRKLLEEWNHTPNPFPSDKTIHGLFEAQVEKSPDRVAVYSGEVQLSYKTLDEQANRLKSQLIKDHGVRPGDRVMVRMDRSEKVLIAILGILKSSGAYVPIDPRYPEERTAYILKDCRARALITDNLELIIHPTAYSSPPLQSSTQSSTQASSLAYIIYTSGSTGRPKGVLVEHPSVVNLLFALWQLYGYNQRDVYLLKTSLTFDVSIPELFAWFRGGARLAVLEKDGERDPHAIIRAIHKHRVTHINFVPSMFKAFSGALEPVRGGNGKIASLRYIFLAGEPLPSSTVQVFRQKNTLIPLENLYGPTEATVYASRYSLRNHDLKAPMSIGTPIANTRIHILDRRGNLLPIGITGEICLCGPGLARGYLNNPELTNSKFQIPISSAMRTRGGAGSPLERGGPRSGGVCRNGNQTSNSTPLAPNTRIYHTGDLGSWMPNGTLKFSGRIDQQVKIRGFRIELGEIQHHLLSHPQIKDAAVTVHTGNQENSLSAFIVTRRNSRHQNSGQAIDESFLNDLKEHLAKFLPGYMIPSFFVSLEKLPLNSRGKADKKALALMKPSGATSQSSFTPPRNETEKQLLSIWREVLGIGNTGIHDNFFDCGGHSLSAIRMAAKIQQRLSIETAIGVIFNNPTIASLATFILNEKSTGFDPIRPVEERQYHDLSNGQHRLWLLNRFDEARIAYNMPAVFSIRGALDIPALNRALSALVQRHESLRTSFKVIDGVPRQIIHKSLEISIHQTACTEEQVEHFIKQHAEIIFDLSQPPLFSITLLSLPPRRYILLFNLHHIIADGWSMEVLTGDLSILYNQTFTSASASFPPLDIQYKDYSQWQNRQLQEGRCDSQRQYWLETFSSDDDIPLLHLPTDYPRPNPRTYTGHTLKWVLEKDLTAALYNLCRHQGITPFMALLSTGYILLSRYSGQQDIIIGSPAAGRRRPELEKQVGFYVNTLPLRQKLNPQNKVRELFKRVKQSVGLAHKNQDYPFDRLVEDLKLPGDTSRHPLFDVMMVLHNNPHRSFNNGSIQITPMDGYSGISKFDLTLGFNEQDGAIQMFAEYNTALFKAGRIERMAKHFMALVRHITLNPGQKIRRISMLDKEEHHLLLHYFNDTQRDFPLDKTIGQLFLDQAKKSVHRTALAHRHAFLTYGQLKENALDLAAELKRKGLIPGTIAAIIGHRSPQMITGILAILLAGCAYLPLDPDHPEERSSYILKDSRASLIIDTLDGVTLKPLHTSSSVQPITQESGLAYIIYTSGSTGRPKGVMIEHRNVLNTLMWFTGQFHIDRDTRLIQLANYIFDPSVEQIFSALLRGARLHLPSLDLISNLEKLYLYIDRKKIAILNAVPALLAELLINRPRLKSIRCVISGGDRLEDTVKNNILDLGYDLYNFYGPTETSIEVLFHQCSSGEVTLGKPIANMQTYILDPLARLLPAGVAGEICISGNGVARGYLNNPQLTRETFIPHPFLPGKILYKTGDRGLRSTDGSIRFLGRIDRQIKIRGRRIELSEIEHLLNNHPLIKEAAVIAGKLKQDTGQYRLTAYLVFQKNFGTPLSQQAGERPNEPSIEPREYLSRFLPAYQVPTHFIQLEKLPLTPIGKIDWKELNRLALDNPRSFNSTALAAPENETQKKLLKIWQEVLELKDIGIDDHFFQLGGHSLNATRVVAKIQQEMQVETGIIDLFKNPSIRELALLIEQKEPLELSPIPAAAQREYYDLSNAQRRLWVLSQFEEARFVYNIPAAFDISGPLDINALQSAFRELIQRHESLRTSFVFIHGQPRQLVHPEVECSIRLEKISPHRLNSRLNTLARTDFHLARPPLFNVTMLDTGNGKHTLLLNIHHIIADGWSMDILMFELITLYNALTRSPDTPVSGTLRSFLPELRIQYKDYTLWQNRLFNDKRMDTLRDYWIHTMTDGGLAPVLEFPADYPRPAVRTYDGGIVQSILDSSLTQNLNRYSRSQGLTAFMTLLTAVYTLIFRYTGQEDIIIGSPIAARRHPDLEEQVGFYVNTLPLRCPIKRQYSAQDLSQRVKQVTGSAYENQMYPFDRLVQDLDLARDASRHPLFDIMVVLHNNRQRPLSSPGIHITNRDVWAGTGKFDLTFNFVERDGQIHLFLQYNSALFKQDRIRRLCTHFSHIVDALTSGSNPKPGDIDLLTVREKHLLLNRFNDTQAPYPDQKTITLLWQEQVNKTPHAIALESIGAALTFKELDHRAGKITSRLTSQLAIIPDDPVALLADRDERMIIAILAILKAGGAYLPIDPDYPKERIDYILKDSNAKVLIDAVDQFTLKPLRPSTDYKPAEPADLNPSHLAYILYTSGSTGKPKGVMISHGSVVNLVYALYNRIYSRYHQKLKVALAANFVFDASVQQIFAALLDGHCLSIIDSDSKRDPRKLNRFLEKHSIQLSDGTPTLLSLMTQAPRQNTHKSALKHLIIGGEVLSTDQVNAFYDTLQAGPDQYNVTITNIYGPAESTVDVCSFDIFGPIHSPSVPIGKPLSNIDIHITDRNGNLTPIGVPGEICISGPGLARGYLNTPEQTALKFTTIKSPIKSFAGSRGGFSKEPLAAGGNVYKTGDLGTWDASGNIIFLGRRDEQVKIRGFRIELGEIQNRLLSYPYIYQAAVTTIPVNGHPELIAFYTVSEDTHSQLNSQHIRQHLETFLPAYMVPAYFIQMETMPLNASGKTDKQALIRSIAGKAILNLPKTGSFTPPSSPMQTTLVRIWQDVLGLDHIGIHDHFFQLGGHSLKAVQIVSRIYKELSIEIPLSVIFKNPDIHQLAALVEQKDPSRFMHILPVEERQYYNLSAGQRRLWVLSQFRDQRSIYNMPAAFSLSGPLHIPALEQALQTLVDRHQSLRTGFSTVNNTPVQIIHHKLDFHLTYREISDEAAQVNVIRQHAGHEFDLSRPPLFKVSLLKKARQQYILLFNMHHIIGDGWSAGILIRELSILYNDFLHSSTETLSPPPRIQYKDYARWQQELLKRETLKPLKDYWLKSLSKGADLPVLELPADFPRPPVKTYSGASIHRVLDDSTGAALNTLAGEKGLTLFMTLVTAIDILLYRYTGQQDIITGTPVAGRDHPDLENQIGFYVNTLALRHRVNGETTIDSLLSQVGQNTSATYENQLYPFDRLVDELDLPRDTSRHPLFDVMVVLQNNRRHALNFDNITITPIANPTRISKFDLTFEFEERDGHIYLLLEYDTALFKAQRIQRLYTHFTLILKAMLRDASQKIRHIDILSLEEKDRLQRELNDNGPDYSRSRSVTALFSTQVERTPHATALIYEDSILSYRQLDEMANQLALILRQKGVTKGSIAAIQMERSHHMIITILAILKAGGAYLPIDPDYPRDRISYMLKDSNASVKIRWVKGFQVQTLRRQNPIFPAGRSSSSGLAYLIYTSGSTGRPKGVMIEHHSLANYVRWANRYYFEGADYGHFGLYTPITFDLTVTSIYCTLTRGKSLYIHPSSQEIDTILEHSFNPATVIDCIKMTPSHINVLESLHLTSTNIRLVIAGGEELTPKHIAIIKDIRPDIEIVNEYGPTEATVGCIVKSVERGESPVLIGRPEAGASIFILDRDGSLLPPGITGQLCIAGPGLARGYLNNPEQTAKHFLPPAARTLFEKRVLDSQKRFIGLRPNLMQSFIRSSNAAKSPLERGIIGSSSMLARSGGACRNKAQPPEFLLYHTGDLARLLDDGNIQYLGRKDSQVKIRGFRIELAEIEHRLRSHPEIHEAAVIAKQFQPDEAKQLAAFVSLKKQGIEEPQFREYLGRFLPAYMIPHFISILDRLPLTPNAKIDKSALADMEISSAGFQRQYSPPRNETERILVETWQQVLKRTPVGIEDNFFQSGGDSIKAIQIASRLHQSGLKLELKALFNHPTIKELSPFILKTQRTPSQNLETGPVELTPIQHWFFENHSSHPQTFNQAVMLYKKDRFDSALLARSFNAIIRHHDALRMVYKYGNGRILQQNRGLEKPLFHLETLDTGNNNGHWKEEIEQTVHRFLHDIDLKTGPLVKLALFKTQQGDHLLIVIHHLVIDGVSWRILLEDFRSAYQCLEKGQTITLPGKTDSFRQWAVKQKEYAEGTHMRKELEFWKTISKNGNGHLPSYTQIKGEKLRNSNEKEHENTSNNNGNNSQAVSIRLTPPETKRLLQHTSHTYNTEINDLLLTALAIAIERAWGVDKTLVNLEGHGREEILDDVNISRTIGWFTSQFPVMLDISRSTDLSYRIRWVKNTLRRIPNKGIGFGILKYLSPYGKQLARTNTPPINFNYMGEFSLENQLNNGLFTLSELSAGNGGPPQNGGQGVVDINGILVNGTLRMRFGYDTRYFGKQTIETLAQCYKSALLEVASHCASQRQRRFTPSDYGCPSLSLESLDKILQSLDADNIDKIYSLSPMQEGLLFHWLLDKQSAAYFEQFTFNLEGCIDPKTLEKSINFLAQRHDILRTAFIYKNIEMNVQAVLKERPINLLYQDLSNTADNGGKNTGGEAIDEYRQKDKEKGFHLSAGPLMRFALFKTGGSSYVMVWSHHHILMDGWCMSIFFKELFTIYHHLSSGQTPRLAPAVPFMNYIRWLEKQDKEDGLAYWEHYLKGLESPTGLPRPAASPEQNAGQSYLSQSITLEITTQDTAKLNRLAAQSQVTPNTLFQTIWAILLMRYNNTSDVVFGSVVSGRSAKIEGIESILGLFINTLPVRIQANTNTTFSSLILTVQEQALESRAREYLPLSDIQARTPLKTGLIDHITVFQNYPFDEELTRLSETGKDGGKDGPAFGISSFDAEEQTNYDLNIVTGPGAEMKIVFYYNARVYDRPFIQQVAGHYKQALHEILNNHSIDTGHISILTHREKRQILVEFNRTAAPYPHDKTITQLFEDQAASKLDHIAIYGTGISLTYRWLNREANRLANYLLHENRLPPDQPAGIMLDRGPGMIVALLGILKAGGAYVPITPSLPQQRIKHMIADSAMTILISQKRYIRSLNRLLWECPSLKTILCIDSENIHREKELEESELMSRKLWEYVGQSAKDEVTGGGWNSSYTGQPLSKAEMDEYGENVLKKLQPLLHKDMRVLEIGAASGITMFRIAPFTGLYYGTDLSRVIIEKNKQRASREGFTNIKLDSLAAHDIHLLDQSDFDLVILNSVVQCFNGHNYLENVIRKVIGLMRNQSRGYIFIGDIMDLDRKKDLTASLHRFKETNKGRNYKTNTDLSQELFISRAFLQDLAWQFPAIAKVEFSDKIHTIENELTRFRFDALIHIDKQNTDTETGVYRAKEPKQKHRHDLSTLKQFPGRSPSPANPNPHQLAYIIYTSGSTGKPKGVMIQHSGFINMALAQVRDFDVTPQDKVLQFAAFSFDAAMSEIFMALFAGASLVLIHEKHITDIKRFLNLLNRQQVSIITLPPTYLRELTRYSGTALQKIKTLITAGEPPYPEDIKHYSSITRYFNAYGPTENSVCATYFRFPPGYTGPLTIGKPIANTAIFILDKQGNPQPTGISGEICITSPGLARGYLNNPELTTQCFPPAQPGYRSYRSNRSYKTGDAGYYLPDGNIVFTGRIDRQVKIRGYRIELTEIENLLLSHNEIETAAVISKDTGGENQLIAYYKPKNKIECWPSLAEYYLYDDLLYHTMTHDKARNEKFSNAIIKVVPDKVILEIGPGSDAVLSRMCVEHGARHVYAVELLEDAWRKAKETIARLGLEHKITVIHGDITKVSLPEKVDYCVSEIVGAIGGSEGAAKLINHARPMLKNPANMIPMRSLTRIAAVTLPDDEFNYSFEELGAKYVEKVFQHVGYSFDLRLCLHSFPKKNVISSAGVFEDLDFRTRIPLEEEHSINLEITRDATMHGFIVWLNLYLDQDELIDALERKYIWLPVFFPIFPKSQPVRLGDRIQATVTRTLYKNGLNPDFAVNGTLLRENNETVDFTYTSRHVTTAFKADEFYQRIFSANEASKDVNSIVNITKHITGADLKEFLEQRLPGYMLPSHFVSLEEIPVTAHGKIDLKALPAPGEISARRQDTQYILPRNEIEEKLVEIWQAVLGQQQIGAQDNFFELGGNSLKIIRLSARLNETLGENIPIAKMFEYPTIHSFAAYLAEHRGNSQPKQAREPETKNRKRSKLNDRKQRLKRTRQHQSNGHARRRV